MIGPSLSEPSPHCHRYFFALRPEPLAARSIEDRARAELGDKGLVPQDRLHVTLGLTEDFAAPREDVVAALVRAGAHVRADPFELRLDWLVGRRHVVWLAPSQVPSALRTLQTRIAAAMAAEGVAMRTGWTFAPHMTLAYRKGPCRKNEPFDRPVAALTWPVRAFVLVHSAVGLGRHTPIATWPIGGAEQASERGD